jgi:hypothetical protein
MKISPTSTPTASQTAKKTVKFNGKKNTLIIIPTNTPEKLARLSEDFKNGIQIQRALQRIQFTNPKIEKQKYEEINTLGNTFKAKNYYDTESENTHLQINLLKTLGQNIYAQRKIAKLEHSFHRRINP